MNIAVGHEVEEFPNHKFFAMDFHNPRDPWVADIVAIRILRVRMVAAVASEKGLNENDIHDVKFWWAMVERQMARHRPKLSKTIENDVIKPFVGQMQQVQEGYLRNLKGIRELYHTETGNQITHHVIYDLLAGGSMSQKKTPLGELSRAFLNRDISAARAFEDAIDFIYVGRGPTLGHYATRDPLELFPEARLG